MRRFLEQPAGEQRLALTQVAERRGLTASSVEKDLWVCWTLAELYALPELADHLTFKGGTSLSLAWGLIDRFSEDLDLTIARAALGFGGDAAPERATSRKQQSLRLKALKTACRAFVQGPLAAGLAQRIGAVAGDRPWRLTPDAEDPDGQTLLFDYPSLFPAAGGRYVAPTVKIELGARSDPWPVATRTIRPQVAVVFPQAFARAEVDVQALLPRRTFWEKAMLLHEETFRPTEKPRRPRMARHYYDLYRLIDAGIGREAAADRALFEQTRQHRLVFFRQTWVDYETLAQGTLRLLPPSAHDAAWREDYSDMQREMFSTPPPPFDEILRVVGDFERAFNAA